MKKYALTDHPKMINIESGKKNTLYRIRALKDFSDVKAGDLGGYVESEANLSHEGDCWIYDNAAVFDNAFVTNNARVYGDAYVFDHALVAHNTTVTDNARVYGDASISGEAEVLVNARVFGSAGILGKAQVYGHVFGDANISGSVLIGQNARIYGKAKIRDKAKIEGSAHVFGEANVEGSAAIFERAKVSDNAIVRGTAEVFGEATIQGRAIVEGSSTATEKGSSISGSAMIYNEAKIFDQVKVSGNASVYGKASVWGSAVIAGRSAICGDASVGSKATVQGFSTVCGQARIFGNASLDGNIHIQKEANIFSNVKSTYIENFLGPYSENRNVSKVQRYLEDLFYGENTIIDYNIPIITFKLLADELWNAIEYIMGMNFEDAVIKTPSLKVLLKLGPENSIFTITPENLRAFRDLSYPWFSTALQNPEVQDDGSIDEQLIIPVDVGMKILKLIRNDEELIIRTIAMNPRFADFTLPVDAITFFIHRMMGEVLDTQSETRRIIVDNGRHHKLVRNNEYGKL